MAKHFEGVPRRIAEARLDVTTVNNWHWSERNASYWSKNKFKELFIGLKIVADIGYCEITEMLKCNGEAVVYNRKGRLIHFYEWHIEMKWIGALMCGKQFVEGKVVIMNFTDEHDIKDTNITVYCDQQEDCAQDLRCIMEKIGGRRILDKLETYVVLLKDDFLKDLLKSTHLSVPGNTALKKIFCDFPFSTCQPLEENNEVADMHTTEAFKCSSEELYRVLTDKKLIEAFTGSGCLMEPMEGGKFELFNGNVEGHFIKLQPFEIIILKWRLKSWQNHHYSDVVICIEQKDDYTVLKLTQSGIPKEKLEVIREGWKKHYWDNIKRVFGFGAFLF